MKKYLNPYVAFSVSLCIVAFIPRGSAKVANPIMASAQVQALHPSRSVDQQGFFFAHDITTDSTGALSLATTVGTATVTTSDGTRVAGGDIRVMSRGLSTNDIIKAQDDPLYYDSLVSRMYKDSIIELQFQSQLAKYRQRVIDMSTVRPQLAARISAGKNAPPE